MCIKDVRNEIATARRLAWQLASFLETNGHEKQTDTALEVLAALIRANDAALEIQYAPAAALIETIPSEAEHA
jgi:hypothetical protein